MAHAQTSARNFNNVAQSQRSIAELPEWHEQAANAHGSEEQALRVPTRELQTAIAILASWLANPVEFAKLDNDSRIEMQIRLDALRAERQRRFQRTEQKAQATPSQARRRPARRNQHKTDVAQQRVAH